MTVKPTGTQITWDDINGEFGLGRDLGKYRGTAYEKTVQGNQLNYYEAETATATNWNRSETFYMESVTALGAVTMHGYVPRATFTLNLNSLPQHDQVRYQVYWHFVDSLDGTGDGSPYSSIKIDGTTWATFYKQYYNNFINYSGTNLFPVAKWWDARYSHQPWDPYNSYCKNGYVVFDTNWYNHTSSNFQVDHFIGANQAQSDESMYLSHVRVRTRNATTSGYFPSTGISFQNFYSASTTSNTYINVEVLIVGGGGGSAGVAYNAGYATGGGGGGVVKSATFSFSKKVSYTVIIGAGGNGPSYTNMAAAKLNIGNGTRSGVFANDTESLIIAYSNGGGYGGGWGYPGNYLTDFSAGNGGGGAYNTSGGVGNDGNYGGSGSQSVDKYDSYCAGGGGGSSAEIGGTASTSYGGYYNGGDGSAYGGNGGAATISNITGIAKGYGAGGGGGVMSVYVSSNVNGGAGGSGGGNGGNGGTANGNYTSSLGVDGYANTGTGGGGSGAINADSAVNGTKGGSGIVVIKYQGPQKFTGGAVTTVSGYTIHTFTGSGLFSPI